MTRSIRACIVGLAVVTAVAVVGRIDPQSQTLATTSSGDAQFYLRRGEDFSGIHQYDKAIADYTTAIELKPDYAEAYNDRGFAYFLTGDFERAIRDYTRAIELRPNYPKAYNSRGVAYMAGGFGLARSVPDFDRAIELEPDFRYAYINRANARLFSHPWLALQDFHRAGVYPERTVAIAAGVLIVAVAMVRGFRRNVRVARAGIVGSGVTAFGLLLTTALGVEWFRWILLLPWALLETLIPRPDTGTDHPLFGGAPHDPLLAVVGLALSALLNAGLAHFLLPRPPGSITGRS